MRKITWLGRAIRVALAVHVHADELVVEEASRGADAAVILGAGENACLAVGKARLAGVIRGQRVFSAWAGGNAGLRVEQSRRVAGDASSVRAEALLTGRQAPRAKPEGA